MTLLKTWIFPERKRGGAVFSRSGRLPPALTAAILSLLLALAGIASPAHAIQLTMVKHLFDITKDFRQPSDVAVAKDGTIYVVDGVNNCVKAFGPNGGYLFTIGRRGSGAGEFVYPLGIGLDAAGKVYVADSGNHRLQVFSAKGAFITRINMPPKDGKAADPTDVAVDAAGTRCYVADNDNHTVLEYDLAAQKLVNSFGAPGAEKRQFRYPFLLSLFEDNYLYIVDVVNTRVQVLNRQGKFVAFLGGWGVEKGEFFRPKGVAIDKNGLAYVSDSYMGVIQVFRATGAFHSVLGDPETGTVKKFKTPTGLFIDAANRLYVVEMFAEKVSVYDIGGQRQGK